MIKYLICFVCLVHKATYTQTEYLILLISNFRRVINVLCFLLGNSLASEIYIPKFRDTLFHLHRQVGVCTHAYLPMKMEQTECPETSAYKFQTLGNYPKESIQEEYLICY
jgi:hypothetical protein